MNRFDALEKLQIRMDDTEILENLVKAMSEKIALEEDGEGLLGYIARCNEIDLEDEEED